MTNPRFKPLIVGAVSLLAVWALAFAAYRIAVSARMTPEKMAASLRATDLNKLDAAARAKRLRDLAEKLNSLSGDERRRARADREWDRLWNEMSDDEKAAFVESTMPTGVKQMLTAFEQLPEEKRRYAVTNAIARMRSRREAGESAAGERRDREPMSPELQKKVITTGLKTFYSESSAQTKAEVAPRLEEMQGMMESGQLFRR